jgi:hypothetical protein
MTASDDRLCEDMQCPFVFVQDGCEPTGCHAADIARKSAGSIYLCDEQGEHFVGLLPGVKIWKQ